jgi:hypothetical protein
MTTDILRLSQSQSLPHFLIRDLSPDFNKSNTTIAINGTGIANP